MAYSLAVVAGASGGVGRAICEELLAREPSTRVAALSRERPAGWTDDDRRVWAHLDLRDEAVIGAAAEAVASLGDPDLIVVATGRLHGPGVGPEKTYRAMDPAALAELFAVNAIGPALLAKHLLPLTSRRGRSVFAALSARVGSIGDNRLGGWHAYRASKAALNMLVRNLAIEHRRTRPDGLCVALHPGTVDTALSAPFQENVPEGRLLTPARSAKALLDVIDRLGPDDTGAFFGWDGERIPW